MKITNSLIIFDLETTGTWIEKDKIIEIAMIKLAPDGSREEYHKRVNPMIPIPPVVSELTGIKDEDIQDAPSFDKLAKEVLTFIGEADFAGFNIERFDLPLLAREMSDAGQNFSWKARCVFDAQTVFHLNEKRDLTAAYKFYCKKELEGAHSAMVDTKATLEILDAQIKAYGEGSEAIEALEQFKYSPSAEFFDDERKFRWWNGKLYMMFGKYAKNFTLQEVVKKDPGYLEWIISKDFSDEIKNLVANALKGQYPTYNVTHPSEDENGQIELF